MPEVSDTIAHLSMKRRPSLWRRLFRAAIGALASSERELQRWTVARVKCHHPNKTDAKRSFRLAAGADQRPRFLAEYQSDESAGDVGDTRPIPLEPRAQLGSSVAQLQNNLGLACSLFNSKKGAFLNSDLRKFRA